MLDDGGRRLIEFLDQLPGCVQVHQIVVGKFLALNLFGSGDAGGAGRVERRGLMRIFPVAQRDGSWSADVERGGQCVAGGRDFGQTQRDRAIVRCRGRESLLGQTPVRIRGERSGTQFVEQCRVIARRSDHRDVLPVLGGGADHRRPADVDILDQLFKRGVGLGRDLLEFIQIHGHQVDGRNGVRGQRLHVLGLGPALHPGGDARMNGLDAAIEHLGKLGDLGDLEQGRNTRFFEDAVGAAGGENLEAQGGQALGEIDDAGFIGDAEESAVQGGHEPFIFSCGGVRHRRRGTVSLNSYATGHIQTSGPRAGGGSPL